MADIWNRLVTVASAVRRLVGRRPTTFYIERGTRATVEGHQETATADFGPFTGALFDPTMAAPGGPNTDMEDIRTDVGWRLTFPVLPGVTMKDQPSERDSVRVEVGADVTRFRVLKVTPLGGAVTPGGFRAILEKIV